MEPRPQPKLVLIETKVCKECGKPCGNKDYCEPCIAAIMNMIVEDN